MRNRMNRGARAFLIAAAVAASCIVPSNAAPLERSVSVSRQFVVYGPSAQLRAGMCDFAERTKKKLLTLLQQPDEWKTPIVLYVQAPQANLPDAPPAQLNFSQTGFGLKLQLDLTVGADASGPALERELLRALYLEIMYRAEPNTPAGTPYVEPPAWLLDGTLAVAADRDASGIAESLGTVLHSGRVMPIAEFLRQRPELLDSPSRKLYAAYSAALVSLLVEPSDGRTRLVRYLANLPRSGNDPLADLATHFPALAGSAESLAKSWQGSIARLAARERYQLLGSAETERLLAQLLRVDINEKGKPPAIFALEEFPNFVRYPTRKPALQQLRHNILLLSARANPLYQPVLAEYEQIARQLERGKTKRIAERLARARETRELINRELGAIADYMNWFEATQAQTQSGAFTEYMKAAELALERQPRRRDPISVYLDSLEAQMQN